jgi:DnaJ-class molecular chaperone
MKFEYDKDTFDDIDDITEDDESGICAACNGSGEGYNEGTTCSKCKGKGEV